LLDAVGGIFFKRMLTSIWIFYDAPHRGE